MSGTAARLVDPGGFVASRATQATVGAIAPAPIATAVAGFAGLSGTKKAYDAMQPPPPAEAPQRQALADGSAPSDAYGAAPGLMR